MSLPCADACICAAATKTPSKNTKPVSRTNSLSALFLTSRITRIFQVRLFVLMIFSPFANFSTPGQQPRIKTKEKGDEINWFGVKVGAEGPSATPGAGLPAGVGVGGAGGAGVGKYLQLAQPTGQSQPKAQAPTAPPKFTQTPAQTLKRGSGAVDPGEAKKRKTTGFGDFAGW